MSTIKNPTRFAELALLCYFNKAYSLYIMLLFIFVCAINAYQLESHYQRMGRFFQREKDNEIKEVEIENKYHEKILSQLIRSMNLYGIEADNAPVHCLVHQHVQP